MKFFITGGTGYIGAALAEALLAGGDEIKVLVRDPARAGFLADRPWVELVKGSLEDEEALERLCSGCEGGFHLAGLAKASASDPGAWDRVNVAGAAAVAKAARKAGCRRLVHTSSAGVLGPSLDGRELDESSIRQIPFLNEYERTKAASEHAVLEAAGTELEIVIVNPTRVYGPSPSAELTPYNLLLSRYLLGKWHILPGDGSAVGDYAYIEDVVRGHIAAFRLGKPGERYLLGGESLSYARTFELAGKAAALAAGNAAGYAAGRRPALRPTPLPLMLAAAGLVAAASRLLGKEAPITPAWVRRFSYNWRVSSAKAETELRYRKSSAEKAMAETVAWLASRGLAPSASSG